MRKKRWIWVALAAALILLCAAIWRGLCPVPQAEPAEEIPTEIPEPQQTELPPPEPAEQEKTYYDAAAWEDGFLAVGSQGQVTKIGPDGSTETLLEDLDTDFCDVAVGVGTAAAMGSDGTVAVVDENGQVTVCSAGEGGAFRSICWFRGVWLAGGEGCLLQTRDFIDWQTLTVFVKGTVTGLAATEERCIGVTDQGETFTSTDGVSWSVLNYSEYYQQSFSFRGIEALDTMFWAYGVRPDGTSAILLSQAGGVWSERSMVLAETSQEVDLSGAEVGGICSDGDQAMAALSDGTALTMPDCSVCNKLTEIASWRLEAVACNGGQLLFAGEDFRYELLALEDVRQERIQAEAAYEKYRNGAWMIDVRTQEEYNQGHIPGCIRIEVDQVAEMLPSLCPDQTQEIIFYCASGRRSQQAMETARELGYRYVYNLGGLEDWPYEVEITGG